MSGTGAPELEPPDGRGLRVAVLATRWHGDITDSLLECATRALADCRVEDSVVTRVPGAFELPVVARALAERRYDAIVALAVIVRGETPHFDFVSRAATEGCLRVSLDTGVPVGFGVLTCDDLAQARARAGLPDSAEDKGREAVFAAITTALTLRSIRRGD